MTAENLNPLLERARIPGETFALPSRGLFYTNGELSPEVKNGEVYVLPLATYDEILLKTPDKLFSGKAIEEVFRRCIPQILKPLELHAKDVDYLLVCLRKLSYGDLLSIPFTHECENAKSHNYDVSMERFLRDSKKIDPTKVGVNFHLDMENGQVVHLSPPRFETVLRLWQTAAKPDDVVEPEMIRDDLIDMLLGMIVRVDDVSDRNMIREWLLTIPAGWTTKISETLTVISDWGPDFVVKVQCRDCGKEVEVSSPLNPIAFFM